MRRARPAFFGLLALLLAVVWAGSALAWVQLNFRDFERVRNIGLRLSGNSITFSLERHGSFNITDGSDLTAIRNSFARISAIPTSNATVLEGPTFDFPRPTECTLGISKDGVN